MWLSSWLGLSRGNRTTTRAYSSYRSIEDIRTILQTEPDSPNSPTLCRRLSTSHTLLRSVSSHAHDHARARGIPSSITVPSNLDHGGIVVYYTSLRVIRRTFNDCRTVRSILKRFSVSIDERDVCVDERFREELYEILGRRNVPLPCVFIGGEYIGGVDDFKKLYDSGELQEMIERLPKTNPNACEFCGGIRFVVCDECDGSHRVFADKSGFKTCLSCNTNGLIRCPACFFVLPRHTK
ncbi:uncharacterized protein At5g39865 [Lathyrus oleraceus]|uniref:Glutaredoxin domain-containing protein n=1 Tax=Pisum sativum TaxID=3888 RepID=A0A9D4WVX9_PEA|nr:uncharacterized protein At5g39865-like [Pisum sativum]KAI5407680.1 hypothetical protein KIW84_053800 [Pisum sativum]